MSYLIIAKMWLSSSQNHLDASPFVSFLIMKVLVALHENISIWNHLPLERESNKAS